MNEEKTHSCDPAPPKIALAGKASVTSVTSVTLDPVGGSVDRGSRGEARRADGVREARARADAELFRHGDSQASVLRHAGLSDMMDHDAHSPQITAREERRKFLMLCALSVASLCIAVYLNMAVFSKPRRIVTSTTQQLILDYEVGGGEEYYNRNLAVPSWPGEQSGVTIGVGYDLGYITPAQFEADWAGRLPVATMVRLRPMLGITGNAARLLTPALADVRVPWADAQAVFVTRTLPRFEALTRSTFPGVSRLPADAQGALLSQVFNRGTSLTGERRLEMAAIADAVAACRPENPAPSLREIARRIRDMKRLWPTNLGLQKRRDAEAGIVEKCLPANSLPLPLPSAVPPPIPGMPGGPALPDTPIVVAATTPPLPTPSVKVAALPSPAPVSPSASASPSSASSSASSVTAPAAIPSASAPAPAVAAAPSTPAMSLPARTASPSKGKAKTKTTATTAAATTDAPTTVVAPAPKAPRVKPALTPAKAAKSPVPPAPTSPAPASSVAEASGA